MTKGCHVNIEFGQCQGGDAGTGRCECWKHVNANVRRLSARDKKPKRKSGPNMTWRDANV